MFITLVSLILALTLTTTQVREAIAGPPPLNRMAHALASAHSYRVVFISRQTLDNSTSTDTTTVVQHGTTVQTYIVLTRAVQGQKPQLLTEHVETGTQACDRARPSTPWHCIPWPRATHAALVRVTQNPDLRSLHWVTIRDAIVHGQLCRGYRTTWRPAAGAQVRAVLWIARATGRPVEVTDTTSISVASAGGNKLTNTIVETAVWSAWNSSTLRIPRT